MLRIGIIREGKLPSDSRVPLTPQQCKVVQEKFPVQILVQPSPNRCYSDAEYVSQGIQLSENLSQCEVLMGVKEVPIEQLVPDKTYFFFSHTIKLQAYNQPLLKAIVERNIRLLDYEVLTNEKGQRLIAFGVFAGMVGAHNGIMTYGWRTEQFKLPRMKDCKDYADATYIYKSVSLPPMRVVLTGTGRVASGAARVLSDIGLRKVAPDEYLKNDFEEAVFTQLSCADYVAHNDGQDFVQSDFYASPKDYHSIFAPFAERSDVMVNGIYWDNAAPAFFTLDDMRKDDFKIKVIADVTCDIAPVSSIPSTIKASTIADPIFGFDPTSNAETKPHQAKVVDMMTIDNLPNELPRDASEAFGEQFIEHILQELLNGDSGVIERATVTVNGDLGSHFEYLRGYLNSEV